MRQRSASSFRIVGLRVWAAGLAIAVAMSAGIGGAAPAFADPGERAAVSGFECGWRALPAPVRISMTENLRTPEDMANLGERLSGLSDDDLLAAGRRCQFDVSAQAEQFGGFIAARALTLALAARLQMEFGAHDGQLDAFVEALGPRQRAAVAVNMMAGESPSKEAIDAIVSAIDRSGVNPSDQTLRGVAVGYAVSRVAMEELAR